ncbi:hypothetical protein BH581_01990 [Vibrio splendidus]|nr:hypothetical protein BH581_01990 [Vibrio splendidus]
MADKFLAVLSSADKSMNPYLLLTLFALRDKHYSVYECWVGSDINATTLQKVMESAGLDKTSLPLHRGNSGYFVAIEGTEAVDFNLYEMLYCMDKYSSFKSYGDKNSEERSLRANSRVDDYDAGEKNYIQLNFLGLAAKKSDYIDWVEYAVSFDE